MMPYGGPCWCPRVWSYGVLEPHLPVNRNVVWIGHLMVPYGGPGWCPRVQSYAKLGLHLPVKLGVSGYSGMYTGGGMVGSAFGVRPGVSACTGWLAFLYPRGPSGFAYDIAWIEVCSAEK